jgi:hypothetical protein
VELEERMPGRYWIYRASVHDPGQYVKGLLTVRARYQQGKALDVSEQYRVPGNAAEGQYGLQEVYEGLILQQSHRPFMVSCLRLPAPHGKPNDERQDAELAVLRVTFIAGMETHTDGKIASMIGFTTANYLTRGFLASPICFERIPDEFPRAPEEELKILSQEQLPSPVRNRLSSFITAHGLIRL